MALAPRLRLGRYEIQSALGGMGEVYKARDTRIELTGGPLQVLADAPYLRGGTWNADGVIVFAPSGADPLLRVATNSLTWRRTVG
jgi:hypothetical protein